ncbi:MAG: PhzF family phenazine biosynthesis protein [Gammaproteobacteria bacterium]|nr:PhzF family phenazine biosynthesis protein [Gammaproteobacteria bacterium]
MNLKYLHLNVFASTLMSGNGLIVFYDYPSQLKSEIMLKLTQEMRQFESIFLQRITDDTFTARIFTKDEELNFAGHPILGAGVALHYINGASIQIRQWKFQLEQREILVDTHINKNGYHAAMNQGKPQFIHTITAAERKTILDSLNLTSDDLFPGLPLEVVSTGLPHLIIPLAKGIERAKILNEKFECLLESVAAKFVYVLDIATQEGRTWDNAGTVEDIATGSAAGPAAAYLYKHKLVSNEKEIIVHQGRFANRPSKIKVEIKDTSENISSVFVSGNAAVFALGEVFLPE